MNRPRLDLIKQIIENIQKNLPNLKNDKKFKLKIERK